jgi:uncharacterized protein
MRRDLTAAMKARDKPAIAALRSTLAAIDNAEAVDAAQVPAAQVPPAAAGQPASEEIPPAAAGQPASEEIPPAGRGHPAGEGAIAGAALGVGAAEVERRALSAAETEAIVRREVAERQRAADAYERAGQAPHAERLRAEAELLDAYLAADA